MYNGIEEDRAITAAHLSSMVHGIAAVAGMQIINITVSHIKDDLEKLGKATFEDEGGISVQALISTSHISLHVWPNRNAFMADVVSCREFDADAVHNYVVANLDVREVSHHVVYKPSPKSTIWCFTPIDYICQL
jgi:S-adenosylmethionine/arginine decarboxylase-like enzyme